MFSQRLSGGVLRILQPKFEKIGQNVILQKVCSPLYFSKVWYYISIQL